MKPKGLFDFKGEICMLSWTDKIDIIINSFKKGVVTFEDCNEMCNGVLKDYKKYLADFDLINDESKQRLLNNLRIYTMGNLTSALSYKI